MWLVLAKQEWYVSLPGKSIYKSVYNLQDLSFPAGVSSEVTYRDGKAIDGGTGFLSD